MGTQNSSIKHPVQENREAWKKQASLGNCQLVKNQEGKLGELYLVSSKDTQKQLNIYRFRYDNPDHIVSVYHASMSQDQFLCGTDERIHVITERISHRLGDLGNIGFGQGLYAMERILTAAQVIQDQYLKQSKAQIPFDSIHYDQNMICFTDSGVSKLWINEDISLNNHFSKQSEEENINTGQNLMNLLQNKMSGKKFIDYMKSRIRAEQSGILNDLKGCLDFVRNIRQQQQRITGEKINRVILPHMILNLGKNKNREPKRQEVQSVYGSDLRVKIQEAKTTHDYSKLERPPIPRKSSRSKSGSRSRSKDSREMTPTKNPMIITPNIQDQELNKYQDNSANSLPPQNTRSFPIPNQISSDNFLQRKISFENNTPTIHRENIVGNKQKEALPQQKRITARPFQDLEEQYIQKIRGNIRQTSQSQIFQQKQLNKVKSTTEIPQNPQQLTRNMSGREKYISNQNFEIKRNQVRQPKYTYDRTQEEEKKKPVSVKFNQFNYDEFPRRQMHARQEFQGMDRFRHGDNFRSNQYMEQNPKSIPINFMPNSQHRVIVNGRSVYSNNNVPQRQFQTHQIYNSYENSKPMMNFYNSPKINFSFGGSNNEIPNRRINKLEETANDYKIVITESSDKEIPEYTENYK